MKKSELRQIIKEELLTEGKFVRGFNVIVKNSSSGEINREFVTTKSGITNAVIKFAKIGLQDGDSIIISKGESEDYKGWKN